MSDKQSAVPIVAVIMSTYNGEKFLDEQINSILSQKDVVVHLYVRDDGSTDSTRQILSNTQKNNKNLHLFFENNIGVGNSFMKCLYYAKANYDYYAFSDQDDIWLPEKLIKAITFLEENHKELYCSNQMCVDRYGNRFICGVRIQSKWGRPEKIFGTGQNLYQPLQFTGSNFRSYVVLQRKRRCRWRRVLAKCVEIFM